MRRAGRGYLSALAGSFLFLRPRVLISGIAGSVVMAVVVAAVMVVVAVIAVIVVMVMLALALGDDTGTQVFPAPVAVRGGQIAVAGAAGTGVSCGICILSHGILL